MLRRIAVCLLLAGLVSAGIPALSAGKVTHSELISIHDLDGESFVKELDHRFSQQPDKVRVRMKLRLKRGSFSFRVETPDGRVVWRKEVKGPGRIELVEAFPGEAGVWRIILDSDDAKGRYSLSMKQVDD